MRRVSIAEDCQRLRPDQLVKTARAALASGDPATVHLYDRYLARRVEAEPRRVPELTAIAGELAVAVADPKANEKRERLGRKIESAKLLHARVTLKRYTFDGRADADKAGMRARYAAS